MVQMYLISRKVLGALLFIPFYSLDVFNCQLILLSSPFQTVGIIQVFHVFGEFTIPQESKQSDLLFLNLSNTIHVSLFSTTLFRDEIIWCLELHGLSQSQARKISQSHCGDMQSITVLSLSYIRLLSQKCKERRVTETWGQKIFSCSLWNYSELEE